MWKKSLLITLSLAGLSSGETFTVSNPAQFQNALTAAESNGEDDIIYVNPGTYSITNTLTYISTENKSLTIRAADLTNPPILDGGSSVRIMKIDTSTGDNKVSIVIKGLILRNGYAKDLDFRGTNCNGGGLEIITSEANVRISNSRFIDNYADCNGGGVYITGDGGTTSSPQKILINKTIFKNNKANNDKGGGLYVEISTGASTLEVRESIFSNNTAKYYGGGAYINTLNANTTIIGISGSTFSACSSSRQGGGLYAVILDGEIAINGSSIIANESGSNGGGAYILTRTGKIAILSSDFIDNRTTNTLGSGGGGLYAQTHGADIEVTASNFDKNSSAKAGGGAYLYTTTFGNIMVSRSTFSNNIASGSGGGLHGYVYEDGNINLDSSLFSGNTTTNSNGGGAYLYTSKNDITLRDVTFRRNKAVYNGGGLFLMAKNNATITYSHFINNTAGNSGGGAYLNANDGTFVLTYSVFKNNLSSKNYGGGAYVHVDSTANDNLVANNVFLKNSALNGSNGGGMTYRHDNSAKTAFLNNTFANNSADGSGGGLYFGGYNNDPGVDFYNNLFWQNNATSKGNDLYIGDANELNTINLFNNNFSGNADLANPQSEDLYFEHLTGFTYNQGNNIQQDPLFAPDGYHLKPDSPMINAGVNTAPFLSTISKDIDKQSRIHLNVVDIGADEAVPASAE